MSGTNRLFILHAKPQALTPCFQAAVCVLLSAVLLLLRMENLSGVAKLAAFPVIYPGMGKWEFILVVWCLHVYFGHQGGGRLLKQLCGICSLFSLMLSPKRVNREWNVEPEL